MVYLDSSSARTVDCALNTIYSELIIAKERLATDTENGIILILIMSTYCTRLINLS